MSDSFMIPFLSLSEALQRIFLKTTAAEGLFQVSEKEGSTPWSKAK